ncbi:MAG: sodium:alanine symporter family protein [Lachnospiraceae bacterium]|nr:sodium:alanine symporter family protein [Lachnospiraceae bacterium]
MNAFLGTLEKIVETINTYLSDYILIFLLVGTGLFYTIKTRFVQVRCFKEGVKKVFGNFSVRGGKQKSGLSSFQALATAIAAQVGTGNIVGASGAILIGGPGAIFWMWVIAFFGMATIYAEAVLAQNTKIVQEDGNVLGGPVYYIKKAYKGKFGKILAGFFAVAAIFALGFVGAMVQSNSIASTSSAAFHIPAWVIGLIVAAVCAFIFLGGVQRIAAVAEKIVPFMALLYIVLGLIVLGFNFEVIPETFGMIFKYAFRPDMIVKSAVGGGIGYALKQAISQGAKRGLFSNEAGMGSTPHAHAMANVEKPHDQGVAAMIGVFIDTFIVLTMTALVVISTMYTKDGVLANGFTEGMTMKVAMKDVVIESGNLVQLAMSTVFGSAVGNILVAVCLLFFAFTTILSWNFFGKQNIEYLFGKKAVVPYYIIAIVFVFLGSIFKNSLVWDLTDMFNNLMVIPNVIALIPLFAIVAASAKKRK